MDNESDRNPESHVSNCTSNRCVTCHTGIINCDETFNSYLTGQSFTVQNYVNCKTDWCIYLIRCKHPGCELQYVGQTINTVAKRISSHKSAILHNSGCKVLSSHFKQVHSIEDMSITPIEILDRTLNLKEREEAWMKKLNTIYPYGLNVRAKTCGIMDAFKEVESSKTVVYSKFEKVIRYDSSWTRWKTANY